MITVFSHYRLALALILIISGYFLFEATLYEPLYHWLNPWSNLLNALPYFLTLVIILISWHFHYSKPVWVSVIIALIAFSAQTEAYYQGIFTLTMLVIIPLWMLMLSLLPERPLFSKSGLWQLLLLSIPLLVVGAASLERPETYLAILTYEPAWLHSNSVTTSVFHPLISSLPYPIGIVAAQLVCLLTLVWLFVRYRQQQDIYLLITLLLLSWLLYGPVKPLELILFFNLLLLTWLLAILIHGHNLAYLDELTGLPGRRALNQALSTLSKKSVVAMLDVDHFKKFNDTYGHDVGDQVLKMVASRMRRVKGGKAYRYGGEEFTILFPNTSIEIAQTAAEEVRIAVAEASLQLRGKHRPKSAKKGEKLRGSGPNKSTKSVSVTISIGLAENNLDEPLKVADQKLYDAKQLGRNQVCI